VNVVELLEEHFLVSFELLQYVLVFCPVLLQAGLALTQLNGQLVSCEDDFSELFIQIGLSMLLAANFLSALLQKVFGLLDFAFIDSRDKLRTDVDGVVNRCFCLSLHVFRLPDEVSSFLL